MTASAHKLHSRINCTIAELRLPNENSASALACYHFPSPLTRCQPADLDPALRKCPVRCLRGPQDHVLAELAGVKVGGGRIHGAGGSPEDFDLRATRHISKRFMRGFETFVDDQERVTRSVPCAACSQCDFKDKCEREWREEDSSFIVAGLSGAQVLKLEAAGIKTLSGLASLPDGAKVVGIGAKPLARLAAQARMQLTAREKGSHATELLPVAKGKGFCLPPPADEGDLYFDMVIHSTMAVWSISSAYGATSARAARKRSSRSGGVTGSRKKKPSKG